MSGAASTTAAEYDVVIVGAGPVGLAAAVELGTRGVRCLLVERGDRVGRAPRAKTTNVRTRSHLRRWGIADTLAERSPFGITYPSTVHFVTRLAGPCLARFDDAFNAAPATNEAYPEHAQWIPQYVLEQVLRDHVMTLVSVDVQFGTEFVQQTQTIDSVAVVLRPVGSQTEQVVRARYLIGADGARSEVRVSIGATMNGRYGLSRNYNVVFRAPGLSDAHLHGPGIMYWQVNGDTPSVIGPMDRDDLWYFTPTGIDFDTGLTPARAAALIAGATGIARDYEILSIDPWVASRLIADRYRDARVFLIGDACHLHPPFGGYGMNMGIGDSVDLGWKLAAVIHGWGGPRLLDSYEAERRSVHEWIMDEAEANHSVLGNQLWQDGLEETSERGADIRARVGARIAREKSREFHTLGAVLGYRYDQSSVIAHEEAAPAIDAGTYRPSSSPGSLAPHLWLQHGRSLYDLFGSGFALLVRDGDPFTAIGGAKALHVPLQIVALPPGCEALYPYRFTLVRPDQHVAWRGDQWVPGILSLATGRLGGREASDNATTNDNSAREKTQ